MIGFGAVLLILGHYVDFFNYTFVQPNWNKTELAKMKEEEYHKALKAALLPVAEEGEKKETVAEATAAKETAPAAEVKEGKKEAKEGEKSAAAHGEKKEAEAAPANYAGIGIGEILVFIGFLGAFLYLFFNNLSKRPIIPESDPYLKESEQLEVIYS
jgi:hypothetical protein